MAKKRKLPPRIKHFFDVFCLNANKSRLHPFDYMRFNAFVTACHMGKSRLTDFDLIELLENEGFNREKAEYLADLYNSERDLMKSKYRKVVTLWRHEEHSLFYLYRGI